MARIETFLGEASAPVKSPRDVMACMGDDLEGLDHEECWALFLRADATPIKKQLLTMGSLSQVTFDRRRIVKEALLCDASGVIVLHNHPSGNVQPSSRDIQQTMELNKACETLEIKLLDHIIVGRGSCYSFSEEKTFTRP